MQESRRAEAAERFFAILGRSVFAFILLAGAVEVFSFVALHFYNSRHRDPLIPQNSPAYDREPWGREFWAEQSSFWSQARSKYLPFTVWSAREWHGKYINTDTSEMGMWRRSIQAMNDGCSKIGVRTIWVFGGSTVYGIGTPDSETIPSYLARDLNTNPSSCVSVTNFGAEGYVTNQEVILLLEQLKAGRKPDIAIFYDGINDALVGGFSPGIPTAHWNFEMIRAKFENPSTRKLDCLKLLYSSQLIKLIRENHSSEDNVAISDSELKQRAQSTLNNYEGNLKAIRILARAYGFKPYFFWQPVLAFGDKPLATFEKQLSDARREELAGRVYRGLHAVYVEAERQSDTSRDFAFLGHVFDDVKDPIYIDEFHLDPHGNELIAQLIAEAVQGDLASQ